MSTDPPAKLTPAQAAFLRAVVAGDAYRSESTGTLYQTFVAGQRRAIRATTVDALCDAGLIRWSRDRHPRVLGITSTWQPTDAGRNHPAATEEG